MSLWIKLFFVLTPFFSLTMFLTLTETYDRVRKKRLAITVSMAAAIICLILFFAGHQIFALFGITLNSFRIGAGILLMLSGIELAQGKTGSLVATANDDIAVVPLAIPVLVGPATTGTVLVMGAELTTFSGKMIGSFALICAIMSVGTLLMGASFMRRLLGLRGLSILSRLTGLILAALAAQMIMTGVKECLISCH